MAVTPLRIAFLVVLVGTTLEVLTRRTRDAILTERWRARLQDHTVIVGYGTKGRAAARTLLDNGSPKESIVVVDPDPAVVDEAASDGFAGVLGDGTRSHVLGRARIRTAGQVIIATRRDDTTALVTLTARSLNPGGRRSWPRSARRRTTRWSARAAPTWSSPRPRRPGGCWAWPRRAPRSAP
ncbi:NAD-binding protein [Nonomuraea ferruginea]